MYSFTIFKQFFSYLWSDEKCHGKKNILNFDMHAGSPQSKHCWCACITYFFEFFSSLIPRFGGHGQILQFSKFFGCWRWYAGRILLEIKQWIHELTYRQYIYSEKLFTFYKTYIDKCVGFSYLWCINTYLADPCIWQGKWIFFFK